MKEDLYDTAGLDKNRTKRVFLAASTVVSTNEGSENCSSLPVSLEKKEKVLMVVKLVKNLNKRTCSLLRLKELKLDVVE